MTEPVDPDQPTGASEVPVPPPAPTEPHPSAAGAVAASVATPVGVARRWLRRIARGGQATPADPEGVVEPGDPIAPVSLANRSPFRLGFMLTLGALTAFGLIQAVVSLRDILVIAWLALFIALGLNPVVEWLNARGIRRGAAVALVALTALTLVVLAGWAMVPLLTEQANRINLNAPYWLQGLRENPQIAQIDARYQVIDKAIAYLSSGTWLTSTFGGIMGAGAMLANLLFTVAMTSILTIYFLASLPAIKNVIYELAPASRRPRVRYLANEAFRRIGGYMSGMFLVITLWGVGSFIVLNIAGLGQYSLALAAVAALLSFIPAVGSTIAGILCAIIAFSDSMTAGVIVLAYFVIYQQLDAYVVQPRLFSKSLNVPAVLIILGALSGGYLLGIIGALIAVPTVASLLLLYREVLLPHLERS